MPGEVTLNCQLGKEHMPVTGGSQVAYVLVEVKPTEMMAQVRMPLNFAIVLDRSGSMKGAKLNAVKQAVQKLIDQMADTDTISVVAFDDNVQVIVPAQPAMDKPGIKLAVDRIRDGGGTTMSLGMSVGLNELRKYYSPGNVNRMVLLTDGVTYGDTDRCRALADDAGRQASISIRWASVPIGTKICWIILVGAVVAWKPNSFANLMTRCTSSSSNSRVPLLLPCAMLSCCCISPRASLPKRP